MMLHRGVYFPDNERHMIEWCNTAGEMVDGKTSYQIKKLRKAVSYCKQFRVACDVGGHIGMWSMQLAKQFSTLHVFEPVAAHRECFQANIPSVNEGVRECADHFGHYPRDMCPGSACRYPGCLLADVTLHACALGDHEGSIKIRTEPTSSGDSRVDGDGDIPMHTLDSFNLQDVDFIKIDTEGYELFVVRGAEETIKRCRPVMIVEQKGHGMKFFGFRKEEGVELLESWGMKRAENMSGDWIMVW